MDGGDWSRARAVIQTGSEVRVDRDHSECDSCPGETSSIRGAVEGHEDADIVVLPDSRRKVCSVQLPVLLGSDKSPPIPR